MRLYILGQRIELDNKSKVAQTKQANDLININTRQTNYTNRFKAPLTASNKRAFAQLGIVGNTSNIPYQRNEAFLYSDSGECFIFNGFSVIKSTSNSYDINIYDGNIDIYKAIENKNLSSLGLTEISHAKNLTNVVGSFSGDLDYKYIIADYNGKMLYDTDKINIDYLVPSVRVKYLWDKIFSENGFTYSGSVFNTFDFENLWMSYPKGVLSTAPPVDLYTSNDVEFVENNSPSVIFPTPLVTRNSTYLKQNTNTLDNLQQIFDDRHFKITEGGNYKVEITGQIRNVGHRIIYTPIFSYQPYPIKCDLWLAKNSENIENSDNVTLIQLLQSGLGGDSFSDIGTIAVDSLVGLQDNDSICFVLVENSDVNSGIKYYSYSTVDTPIDVNISRVDDEIINFDDAFINFKIKDFFNEVMFRYGITPYKDKYTSNYNFLTLQELLQTADVEDWSADKNKFVKRNSESYIYSNYAQQNVFKHKYNEPNDDYYDGQILINNENLQDSRNAIVSKIYVPEEIPTNIFERQTNVYKLWDKEPKDDGTTTYKSLSKRFYFMRYEDYFFTSSTTIGSEELATEQLINNAPFESFFGLSFSNAIQEYYLPLHNILNKARVINADIYLTESDITNLDLTKLYYIKEEGGYFVLNKTINFIRNGAIKNELINVEYNPVTSDVNIDIITRLSLHNIDFVDADVFCGYDNSFFSDEPLFYYLNGVPNAISNTGGFEFVVPTSIIGVEYEIYISDGVFTSEVKTFIA